MNETQEYIVFLNRQIDQLQVERAALALRCDKLENWARLLEIPGCEHLWLDGNGCVHSGEKTVVCSPATCPRLKEKETQ